MFDEKMHPVDQIRETMKQLYDMSLTTSSGGNLSMADGEGCVWMSPTTLDKGALKREEISRYTLDGALLSGKPGSVEWKINIAIHRARPDIKAVLHMHSPGVLCYALARELPNFKLLADAALYEKQAAQIPFLKPGSEMLGNEIVKAFESGAEILFLDSHGVFIGSSVGMFDAFKKFELVTTLSQISIFADSLGKAQYLREEQIAKHADRKAGIAFETYAPYVYPREELAIRDEILAIARRGYRYRLITTAQGNVSARIGANSFLVTPDDRDLLTLKPEDLVRFENGKVEEGKTAPCRSDYLQAIYDENPDLTAVTISNEPHLMAFAVTGTEFELGIDPELYNMVRGIRFYPYGADPGEVARNISMDCTTAVIGNDCVIVANDSIYESLGRAEVADNIAGSLLNMYAAGLKPVKLSDEELYAIRH